MSKGASSIAEIRLAGGDLRAFGQLLFLALVCALGPVSLAASAVGSVDVVVSGSGATFQDAVNEALSEAIAQRMGRDVATLTELKSALKSVSDNEQVHAVATESLSRRVQTATNGFVLGYKVLERETTAQGLTVVKLQVAMPELRKSAQVDRLRIAVAGLRTGNAGAREVKQVEAALKSALTDSRKFAVLDRDWDEEYRKEIALLQGGGVPREEKARLGQRLGTDLLVVGGFAELRVPVSEGNARLTEAAATATFSFSVVDAATGQVKLAKVITSRLSRLQAKQAGGTPEQMSLALATSVGRQVAELVIEAAYPLTVVAVNRNELVLNQGGDRLKAGELFDVVKLGDEMLDPQTGESLGRAETVVGWASIARVTPKMSYAKVEEASEAVDSGMILRRRLPQNRQGASKNFSNADKDW